MRVIQTPDWDVTRRYISAKFNILPKLIRDEVVRFREEVESPFE
jgi:hypothetical protein